MAIMPYLAMTAAEYELCDRLPPKVAWMACHFSPYTTGLSNLPTQLPENSILMVNDSTPIYHHDPGLIAEQLQQLCDQFQCSGVLLDFQRTPTTTVSTLVTHLSNALPCPTGVSEVLAAETSCPIFLSPCPLNTPLEAHTAPWQGREIWLEIARDGGEISVRQEGTIFTPHSHAENQDSGFSDPCLHCHYKMHLTSQEAVISLWRTESDMDALLQKAEALGVTKAIGLYQEFGK